MFNLSSSTPGAPSGRHDVAMQSDGIANISITDTDGPAEILTTKGDIQGFGTAPDRIPAGADNTFVAYDSGQPLGISTRALVAGDIPAIPESRVTGLVSDLALKAPLASPALTGVPTAPTASTPTNTTQIATTAFVQAQGFGSGTVTSAAITVPAEFNVSGSPITTSGTFAITKANQSANLVYAGPTSGGAAAPTFRALVQADLPAQPYDVPCSLVGKPGPGAVVLILTFTRAVTFLGNFSGAQGTVGTNPTVAASYTVNKNGSSIGTVSISTSGVFTFTTSSGASQSFAIGDRMTITAPGSQDATLSDVGFTLPGTR